MLENLEDTDTPSEGPKSSFEDHQARTEEKKESLSSSKRRKITDKASITSVFNTLHPLS